MINLACSENIKSSRPVQYSLDIALEIMKFIKKSPQRDTTMEKIRQASVEDYCDSPSPNIRLRPTR